MENYDTSINMVWQQMQNFDQAYAQGDPEALERIKHNILRHIYFDNDFKSNIKRIEIDREDEINKSAENSLKTIRNTLETQKGIKALTTIDNILKQTGEPVNTVEINYWNEFGAYVIRWLNEQREQPNDNE